MRDALAVCFAAALVVICNGYPAQLKQSTSAGAFIGEGINNIATALLQDSDKPGNAAFSPLGYSAILAALAEGASGDTRAQILAALKLPQDSSLTRATYRTVLSRMREKNVVNKPEFRSWFYVYKKTAQVEDDFTSLLRDSYLMEVRDVESMELDTPTEFFTKKEQQIKDSEEAEELTDKKDEKEEEKKTPVLEQVVVTADEASTTELLVKDEKKETMFEPEVKPVDEGKKVAVLAADEKQPEKLDLKPESEPSKQEAPKSSLTEGGIPTMEEVPVKAEIPLNEEIPLKEDKPIKEEMTVKEEMPKEEEMLKKQETSQKDETPLKEEMPLKEEIPLKEDIPKTEEMPVKEVVPLKEEMSMKEEMPLKQEMPLKEEMPTMQEAPKMADIEALKVKEPEKQQPAEDSELNKETQASEKLDEQLKPEEPSKKAPKDEPAKEPLEKIAMAKFNRGEVKDEKKPTTVSKGGKRKEEIIKDAERKKGRAEEGSDVTDSRQPTSGKSLLTTFNALYYKGMWQTPFDSKIKDNFYCPDGQSKEVTILRTNGEFLTGEINELDATAIELPYKGDSGRYSLLVLLPRTRDGLPQLTAALSKFPMRNLSKYMREKQVDVALPEFEIDCVSHPEAVFRKLGMTSMLDKDMAEFPGISKGLRLYLQDQSMAQLVRFRLDDDSAVANYLSTASMSTRSGLNVFHATHPFLFYLRDNVDGLTVVAGRVFDPSIRPEFSLLQD